jgi:hypothetical protein
MNLTSPLCLSQRQRWPPRPFRASPGLASVLCSKKRATTITVIYHLPLICQIYSRVCCTSTLSCHTQRLALPQLAGLSEPRAGHRRKKKGESAQQRRGSGVAFPLTTRALGRGFNPSPGRIRTYESVMTNIYEVSHCTRRALSISVLRGLSCGRDLAKRSPLYFVTRVGQEGGHEAK